MQISIKNQYSNYFFNSLFPLLGANIIIFPFNRLQNILQIQETYKNFKQEYSVYSLFKEINAKQGYFSYYRGFSPFIYKTIWTIVITKIASQPINKLLSLEKRDSFNEWVLQWSIFVSTIFTYPFEITKTRMQLNMYEKYQQKLYKNNKQCMKLVYKFEGLKALFRGVGISLFQNSATLTTTLLIWRYSLDTLNYIPSFVSMILASLISQLIYYPIDSIKKKIQISGAINHESKYSSYRKCFRFIWENQGLGGFYKGAGIKMISAPLYGLIYLQIAKSTESDVNI